jgi:hypothetical protein
MGLKYKALDVENLISKQIKDTMLKISLERDANKIIIHESNFVVLTQLKKDMDNLKHL